MALPRLIQFLRIGNPGEGYLSIVSEEKYFPFKIKRIFWTYGTPSTIIRGRHAHKTTKMILVALSGKIVVKCQIYPKTEVEFILDDPNTGLYIPVNCWHTMMYHDNAIQLVITNTLYDENDYIRDYTTYLDIVTQKDFNKKLKNE
ncbi:MAG: FdtA/QdtA family cupin domain-containing protein [Saprospiraceae bacterium]|nr:FdtA/QdtA family cupin domain-containing protein [Saprospiraceae bacterium]